jgi:NAD(P)-dependent dehydrogenase (short-subunit alcohol dehydrogenase family)
MVDPGLKGRVVLITGANNPFGIGAAAACAFASEGARCFPSESSSELERAILPAIPLGRVGTPGEIADVILFLASHQARWVTGQVFFRWRRTCHVADKPFGCVYSQAY